MLILAGAIGVPAQPGSVSPGALERIVTGAPFSAESATEVVQTLANGSHIRQTTTAVVARDSSGRTRYSQNLSPLVAGVPKALTVIRDPVAGLRYVLDPDQKTARRDAIRPPASEKRGRIDDADTPSQAAVRAARQALLSVLSARGGQTLAESTRFETALGNQAVAGLAATGARVTAVIPAGRMGNEQPLTFTSEAWYSQELTIVVMSKIGDPRVGDITFRLTRVKRGEPEPGLFEVPPGYLIAGR
jgi:hypothetical protein